MNRPSSSSPLLVRGVAAVLCLVIGLGAAGCGSGTSSTSSEASATTARSEAAGSPSGEGGKPAQKSSADNSITGYGSQAGGAEKAAVVAAVHDYFGAMASGNYAALCADLSASNQRELARFGKSGSSGGCAAALEELLSPELATEAKAAADAAVTSVRIKNGNAFALFTPKGGTESYLVMKHEGGAWKAISVSPGTPVEPTVGG